MVGSPLGIVLTAIGSQPSRPAHLTRVQETVARVPAHLTEGSGDVSAEVYLNLKASQASEPKRWRMTA